MENDKLKELPKESDPLIVKYREWVQNKIKDNNKYWKRCEHNRKIVEGFDWSAEVDNKNFIKHRANLILGSINITLPKLYSRDPRASVTAKSKNDNKKLFCQTLENVLNRLMKDANLKKKAKSAIRASMTTSIGALKIVWQKEYGKDPIIQNRINDTQDNIKRLDGLIKEANDAQLSDEEHKVAKQQLENTLMGLAEKVELVVANGLAIDRVPIDNLLIDTVDEFDDYVNAKLIAQLITMTRKEANNMFGYKLDGANTLSNLNSEKNKFLEKKKDEIKDDDNIVIIELWDKDTNTVSTFALGIDNPLKPAYSPDIAGERFYPFFLIPFQVIDGKFIAPSLVDMTEKLQDEHNDARNKFNEHRKLCKPGYIVDKETKPSTITSFITTSDMEVTVIDTDGKPVNQVFVPRQHPPIDPMIYNTESVRQDWEMVTGQQDAARGVVVKPKTATEATIMEQSMSSRVSEFSDNVETILSEIFKYAGELAIQGLTNNEVQELVGGEQGVDWDWSEALTPAEVFKNFDVEIQAGSNGMPNKIEQQENWLKLLGIIQPLMIQIMQMQAQGADDSVLIEVLKETLLRFDDRIEVEKFIPKKPTPKLPEQIPPEIAQRLAQMPQQ